MAWDGPILTDSGGFQVFSLRHTITKADDEGVTFRSVYDGDLARFTPELAADVQRRLGSDIAMALDVCLPAGASRAELAEAVERTTAWAKRQLAAPRAEGQLVFGIAQGGVDPELRRRSIGEITDARLRRLRARRAVRRGEPRDDARDARDGRAAAPGRPRAVLHGHRRPRRDPRRDRARDRHVRLRPADAARPSGDGVHARRKAEPAQRALHARPPAARRASARARRVLDFPVHIFVIS